MVIIYLLRHAESAPDLRFAEADWLLSIRGEAQARALIPVLERLGIERIVSSPYLRAQHSVLPFATQVGLEIAIEPDLRERKLVVGLNDNWEELIRRAWADFNFCAPGGESGASCQRRMAAVLTDGWLRRLRNPPLPATCCLARMATLSACT